MKIDRVSFLKKQNTNFTSKVIVPYETSKEFAKKSNKWQNALYRQIQKLERNGNNDVVILGYNDIDYISSKITMGVVEKQGRVILANKYPGKINIDNIDQKDKKENLVSLYESIKKDKLEPVSKEEARFIKYV